MTADEQKQAAGETAAVLIDDVEVVGLGSGSTAAYFIRAVAERVRERNLTGRQFVPTSNGSAALAKSLNLPLIDLDYVGRVDLTVDGADEVGPRLSLIKGGGAALLREKLVWEASTRCVVICDAGKRVETLGAFPLPIEVISFGHRQTAGRIEATLRMHGIEAEPVLRLQLGAPVRTDGGNIIYDVACGAIDDPAALAPALKSITGVVEHGLFLNLADGALIGTDDGVIALQP